MTWAQTRVRFIDHPRGSYNARYLAILARCAWSAPAWSCSQQASLKTPCCAQTATRTIRQRWLSLGRAQLSTSVIANQICDTCTSMSGKNVSLEAFDLQMRMIVPSTREAEGEQGQAQKKKRRMNTASSLSPALSLSNAARTSLLYAECFAGCTSIRVVGMCRSRAWRSSIILAVKPPWPSDFLAELSAFNAVNSRTCRHQLRLWRSCNGSPSGDWC